MASWDHRWANPQLIYSGPLMGLRASCPKRCHSGVQIASSWKQERPKGLRKNPWTVPYWLKEFKIEGMFQELSPQITAVKKCNPLPGKSRGQGSLVGCRLWGRRVSHDGSDLAAAAGAVDKEEFSKAPTVKALSGSQCILVTKKILVYQTLTFFIFLWISLFLFQVPSP